MRRLLFCVVGILVLGGLASRTQSPTDDARLPQADYPDVVALWEAGSPAEGLIALDDRVPSAAADTDGAPLEALVLKAGLLVAAGRYEEGAITWARVGDRSNALAGLALRQSAEADLAGRRPQRAHARIAGAPPRQLDQAQRDALLLSIAAAYRAAQLLDQAQELYRELLGRRASRAFHDAATLGLARTLDEAGDPISALALLRNLQLEFREADTFPHARQETLRLAEQLERAVAPFTGAEYRRLVDRLRTLSLFDDALAVLDDWQTADPASTPHIEAAIIDTLYRARLNDRARMRAAAFLDRFPDGSEAADVRVLQYRLDVREGRTERVRVRGRALWSGEVRGIPQSERFELARLLGAYLVAVGAVTEGLDVYRELFRSTRSRDAQTDIMWRAAVAAIKAGQLERAETNLRGVQRRQPDPAVSRLAEYWSAVVAQRRGRDSEATRELTALAHRIPYDYYGVRARELLTAMGAPPPPPRVEGSFPSLVLGDTSRDHATLQAATLLARAGLKAAAARMAAAATAAMPGDRALALLAARALASSGEHRRAALLIDTHFSSFLERPAAGVPSDFWTLAYPRAFWEHVREAADAERVDPLLLLSIARQESRYDPSVRSMVGAVGLFQLMPYTADALAPSLGLDVTDRAVLYKPEVSARFAARLVADHLKHFDNRPVAMMAAYNAGADRAADWWAAAGNADDMFVDTIPYSETRIYVRRVYSNYITYRRLYGDAPA